MSAPWSSGWWIGAARGLQVAALVLAPGIAAAADVAPEVGVKAALLYNFAKFTEWPALGSGDAIVICTVGDDRIGAALVEIVRGHLIGAHPIEIRRTEDSARWRLCHMLFIADDGQRAAIRLDALKTQPVLTVSDRQDFAESDGIIGLYLEGGRVRFAINVDTAAESGLRLSSRLLGLARIVRKKRTP
ncbi:MAG: YfiR family protein [Acidobacteriota bacterium]